MENQEKPKLEQAIYLIADLMGILEESYNKYYSDNKIAECNDFLRDNEI